MQKTVKCKPVDTLEGKFNLVEALLEGDTLTHWQKYKFIKIPHKSKNPDGLDMALLNVSLENFQLCLQELKSMIFQRTQLISRWHTFATTVKNPLDLE
eukprot:14158011-Ditylum_brightwellii.AAC.1